MKRTARNRRRRPPAELMPTSEIAELTTASFLQENNMNGDEGLFDSNGNDRRHQSANGHGAKTSTRPKSKQSCFELLEIHQIPVHLRFNKYVHTHYRPSMTIGGCLKSLFYLHNETVNVLTHGKQSKSAIKVCGGLQTNPIFLAEISSLSKYEF